MTPRYVLTPLAEADLDETWDYVAENFGFEVAGIVLESLPKRPFGSWPRIRTSGGDFDQTPPEDWDTGA